MYKRLLIYYLTGTGNALTAARRLAERAWERGLGSELIPIDRFQTPIEAPEGEGTIVGFLYPTHGFNLPWYMLKFMLAFPRGQSHLFCLNTYGGTKLGKLHLPGLSGLALVLPALLFLVKGYRVRGLVSLNMPSNWISLHPALTHSAVSSLAEHCRKKIDRYAEALFSGGRTYRGLISIPFDLAVSPIALGYFFVGRFWLAKMYMATSSCDGCGICADHCPMNALMMKGGRPFWTFHCESCMRCINICPRRAIQVSHAFTALSAYCLYGVLLPLGIALATRYHAGAAAFMTSQSELIGLVRAWVILSVMFLAYRLAQVASRWRPFNFLFAGLSITRLPFWRRYLAPGVSAKDFKIRPGRK
jgi:Pyruvate/2-oxoacid:ferredoxin oxidoreductase delta subunit